MESLQLPHILLEKMPSAVEAPSSLASGYSEEFTSLFDDYSFADQFLNSIEDDASSNASTEAELAARQEQLILELEQEIKDDSWLDEAPIIYEPTPAASPTNVAASPSSVTAFVDENRPKNTEELLFEFDAVCNAVGITPPASPPATDLLEGAPIYYVIQGEEVDAAMLLDDDSNDDFIDELVRSHSSSIPDDDFSMSSSSPRSDISSPRSDSSFDVAGFDDEEWRPALAATPAKRTKRPYGRPLEEKRVRKKEQNKNAATRYRQKKKQQLEVILGEEEGLKAINLQLQTKLADTKREINYLKKLMREVLVAKGVLI